MPKILNTLELRQHIINEYERLKSIESNKDLLDDLEVFFSEGTPMNIEGSYAYSDQKEYHYAHTERGEVKKIRQTNDLLEMTYWVISDQVFKAALKYATKNANEKLDFRRVLFSKELEILGGLGNEYFKKRESAIKEILIHHPFVDEI